MTYLIEHKPNATCLLWRRSDLAGDDVRELMRQAGLMRKFAGWHQWRVVHVASGETFITGR